MTEPLRVLLVEDDPGDVTLLESSIRGLEVELQAVGTLAEALGVLATGEGAVDVVLTDLGLPDADGQEVINSLIRARPDLPVVALTGRVDDVAAIAAVDAGAQDYVVKGSVGGAALLRILRHALERHRLQRSLVELLVGREAIINLGRLALEDTDLDELMRAAADELRRALRADATAIFESDAPLRTLTARAAAGWDIEGQVFDVHPEGVAAYLLGRPDVEVVVSSDFPAERRFVPPPPLVERGMASCVCIRLSAGRTLFGYVGVYGHEPREFTEEDVVLVRSVGYVLSQALRRTMTERALAERVKEMSVLVGISRDMQSDRPRATIVQRAADRLVRGMTYVDLVGVVVVIDDVKQASGRPLPDGADVIEHLVVVDGVRRGVVRVGYTEPREFVPEEDRLVLAVTGQLAFWIERDEAHTRLEGSRLRLQRLFDNALEAIVVADDDARILHANPSTTELTGYTREELLTRRIWDLTPAAGAEASRGAWSALLASGRLVGDFPIERKDGTRVLTEFRAVANIAPGQHLAVVRDVTDRREVEEALRSALEQQEHAVEQLRAVETMKSGFLQAVSHEIRTPLTSILGYARTLEKGGDRFDEPRRREVLDRIVVNAERLGELIGDLLDVDKLATGALGVRRRLTDVAALAESVVRGMDPGTRTLVPPVGRVVVAVDVAKVERLLEHLVGNAVKHTPEGTRVEVEVSEAPDGVLVSVEDDGPGIAESLRESLFDPFQQGEEMIEHAEPGTGIGLAYVAQVAHAHGGRAWVEDREGGGTRFCVLLAAGGEETREAEEAASTERPVEAEVRLAARDVLRARTGDEIVGIVLDLVVRLGGDVGPHGGREEDRIPIDLGLGTGTPVFPYAAPGTSVRLTLERHLPQLVADGSRLLAELRASGRAPRPAGVLDLHLVGRVLPRLASGDTVAVIRLHGEGRRVVAIESLIAVAREQTRAIDIVACPGSDEVVLVLRDTPTRAAADLVRRISERWASDAAHRSTVSVGVATVDDEGQGTEALERAKAAAEAEGRAETERPS